MLDIVVVIGGVVEVPGLEIRTVGVLVIGGIGNVVGCVVVQEIRKPDICLVIVIGRIVDGIEGMVSFSTFYNSTEAGKG